MVTVVEGHGDTVSVDPRLQLLGQADDGHIDDNEGHKEERHKLGTEHGNRGLGRETNSGHTQEKSEPPEEETARISVVRAKVDFKGQVDHAEEEGYGEIETDRGDKSVDDVGSSGEEGGDDFTDSIVGHGHDEREDEHVNKTDEGNSLSDGLVVRPKVIQRIPYSVGDCRRRLSDEAESSGVVDVGLEVGSCALSIVLETKLTQNFLDERKEIGVDSSFLPSLRVENIDDRRSAPARITVFSSRYKGIGDASIDDNGSPNTFLDYIMSDIVGGRKFRGICYKVVEVGLRKETLRKGLADFTAVSVDDSNGQFVGISVGFPHCALKVNYCPPSNNS